MSALVVIDFGTGGGKCLVFDAKGHLLGMHREPWSYDLRLNPDVPFVKEFSFDAPAYWSRLCGCIRRAVERARVEPRDVLGVAVTSQREGCVFLDASGTEIYAGPNIDARGFREGMEILEVLGSERLYRITGHSVPYIFPLARYLWFRKHGAGRVAHLLMLNDWVTYRLSGELCSEPSNATESMLFDLRERRWSEEILAAFDVPPGILPAARRCGEAVGRVHAAAAAATGLAEGTPVFAGGADTQCSLLGAGAVDPGASAATLGTTTPVQRVVEPALFDPRCSLWAGCHVVPDRWVLESNAGDTGDAYAWLLDLVTGGAAADRLFEIGERLAADGVGAPVMAFIGPTIFDLTRMQLNRPGGLLFPFPALHTRPDRGALVRAFLESVAFAIGANLDQLAAVCGPPAGPLFLGGGMSRSPTLTRLIADVAGVPVRVSKQPETAALGCAMLVLAGLRGVNPAELVPEMTRGEDIEPDLARHERYAGPFAKWRKLYGALDELEI